MNRTERIAPEIFRQRLLIEGFYSKPMTKGSLAKSLVAIANHLDLRTYAEPIVFSPASGMGRNENAGFDAFVPLVDSGISAYVWSEARFLSILLYTCKGFDDTAAVAFVKQEFDLGDEIDVTAF